MKINEHTKNQLPQKLFFEGVGLYPIFFYKRSLMSNGITNGVQGIKKVKLRSGVEYTLENGLFTCTV